MELEEKRRRDLQARRLTRERKIDESLYIWERDIVPDWRVVHRNPALRKLWWAGIPTKLRESMWEQAVGNALALSKGKDHFACRPWYRSSFGHLDNYRTCFARAKRALSSGTF